MESASSGDLEPSSGDLGLGLSLDALCIIEQYLVSTIKTQLWGDGNDSITRRIYCKSNRRLGY